MIDWGNINKVRIHNRNEKMMHFIIKAMCLKLLFNAGFQVYTEKKIGNKIADVFALKRVGKFEKEFTVIEIETKPTKKHVRDLLVYYSVRNYNLYIIDVREIPNELNKMQDFLEHVLGL